MVHLIFFLFLLLCLGQALELYFFEALTALSSPCFVLISRGCMISEFRFPICLPSEMDSSLLALLLCFVIPS